MEFIVDWNSVCLVCLQEGEMRSIYEQDGKLSISEKIMLCSAIEIQSGGSLPEQICLSCCSDLDAAYRFRSNCESTNIILKSFVNAKISNLELPTTNGETFKFKLPSGLHVKKVKANRSPMQEMAVKTEILPEIDEEVPLEEKHEDDHDHYEDEHFVVNDDLYDEDNEPLTNIRKLQEHLDQSLDEILNEADKEHEAVEADLNESPDEESIQTRIYKIKKGRPKITKKSTKGSNSQVLVQNLTSVKYVRKPRDDQKPLKICEICGNSYKFQHALDSHMRRHRNEKPFSCEFCDRAFVANVELRRHMRVHTGQKPYACRHCDRRFSDFGSRIKHERTHTGERPYECATCGKAFAYAHVLQVHTLTHTGEKKYKCDVCGKGFTKKSYLNGHMKLHNDVHSSSRAVVIVRDDDIRMPSPKLVKIEVEEFVSDVKTEVLITK